MSDLADRRKFSRKFFIITNNKGIKSKSKIRYKSIKESMKVKYIYKGIKALFVVVFTV